MEALIGLVTFSLCGFIIGHIRLLNIHYAIIWIRNTDWHINLDPKHIIYPWKKDEQLVIIHHTLHFNSYSQELIITKDFTNIIVVLKVKCIVLLWKLFNRHYQLIDSSLGFYLYIIPNDLPQVSAINISNKNDYGAFIAWLIDLKNTVILPNYEGWVANSAKQFIDLPIGEIIAQYNDSQFIEIKATANNNCWLILSNHLLPC